MIPPPSLSFAVQPQHTGIRVGLSAFPAPLWNTFLLQQLLGTAQHLLFHPGEFQTDACLGVVADGPEEILMCCPSLSPGSQLLAMQRDRHCILAGFFGMEAEFFGVGAKHMRGTLWHNNHFVHEQDKAKLVPPSHVESCGHACTVSKTIQVPFSLSPQGQVRRTAPPAPPRALHPTGAVSLPAVRVSTPPTATGCPTKSARGTEPPEQSQGWWGTLPAMTG